MAAPTETVLYPFTGGSDGAGPSAGLIADSKGNLFGTTAGGGAGYGVVFELSPPLPVGPGPRRCFTPSRGAATGPTPWPALS
jgi:hypothetical protein